MITYITEEKAKILGQREIKNQAGLGILGGEIYKQYFQSFAIKMNQCQLFSSCVTFCLSYRCSRSSMSDYFSWAICVLFVQESSEHNTHRSADSLQQERIVSPKENKYGNIGNMRSDAEQEARQMFPVVQTLSAHVHNILHSYQKCTITTTILCTIKHTS